MSFEKAFAHTLRMEGGYSNIKEDKGGETYIGIARNFHPTWPGWAIIDAYKAEHGRIRWNSKLDDPKLNKWVADFYYKNKWKRFHLDKIQNAEVAAKVFDMVVNHGRGSALVQRAVNELGGKLKVDNMIGRMTVSAINNINPTTLLNRLIANREAYYHYLVGRDPSQGKFLPGWLDRNESFKKKV